MALSHRKHRAQSQPTSKETRCRLWWAPDATRCAPQTRHNTDSFAKGAPPLQRRLLPGRRSSYGDAAYFIRPLVRHSAVEVVERAIVEDHARLVRIGFLHRARRPPPAQESEEGGEGQGG